MSVEAAVIAAYIADNGATPCRVLQEKFGRLAATRGYIELAADYGYTITTDFVVVAQ